MSHTRDRRSVIIVTVVSAWIAHLWAWAASVWLLLGPTYQGVALTTEGTTRVSATFIETNGLHVIWVPIVPVLLSGIALMAILRTGPGQPASRYSFGQSPLCSWGSARWGSSLSASSIYRSRSR